LELAQAEPQTRATQVVTVTAVVVAVVERVRLVLMQLAPLARTVGMVFPQVLQGVLSIAQVVAEEALGQREVVVADLVVEEMVRQAV
jgi:hypothetical protein